MNIVLKTCSGKIVVRPDTTWERDNEDVFLPDFVNSVSYTPVLFARVSKPGRSVGARFASRYYDGVGYGVLLYPDDLVDGSEEGFACASCLDHTSFLPFPCYNPIVLGERNNHFVLKKDHTELFSTDCGTRNMIESAIEDATRYCYIRIGDIVAIELAPRQPLCTRQDGKVRLSGTFCDNFALDFSVIM